MTVIFQLTDNTSNNGGSLETSYQRLLSERYFALVQANKRFFSNSSTDYLHVGNTIKSRNFTSFKNSLTSYILHSSVD
jgi:hypothetical protein